MLHLTTAKNIRYFLILLISFRTHLIAFHANPMEHVDLFTAKTIICVSVTSDGLGKMVFCTEITNRLVKKLFFHLVLHCRFVALILIRRFLKGFVVHRNR